MEFQHNGIGHIYLKNNAVYIIAFSPKTKDWMFGHEEGLNIQFSDAIKKFGEPTNILSMYQEEPPVWEIIQAVYPEKGITFDYRNMEELTKFQENLTPKTPVNTVTYYSPFVSQEVMDLFMASFTYTQEDINKLTHPWSGYGSIKEKYPTAGGNNK